MSNNQISQLLIILLLVLFLVLIVLALVLVSLSIKKRKEKKKLEELKISDGKTITKEAKSYNKQSIYSFMEFDNIEDNMIYQKATNRYLMVVECMGVNYDLMSNQEKIAVEEGFLQFLNTLSHPIQIYTQTRTVNLESSIGNYKKRVKISEDKLVLMRNKYENMVASGKYTKEQLQGAYYEVIKQTNLVEYGKDIVKNTERMSLNKNVLNKQYYIIIPYYVSELGSNDFDKEEIRNLAFSELYTRSQAIIRTLASCEVSGKILNSNALVELLYMSYNRDDAEIFGMDKVLKSGIDELYSTAPDVIDRKMQALNAQIEEAAYKKAETAIKEVISSKQKEYEEKEETIDDCINEMANLIIESNKTYVGEDVAEKAKKKLNKKVSEKGGNVNEEEAPRSKRGRKPKSRVE